MRRGVIQTNKTVTLGPLAIARIAHAANRELQDILGEEVSPPWDDAGVHTQRSVLDGVRHKTENPDLTPEESHENWLKFKAAEGWVYGPAKDHDNKTHPCIMPFEQLPPDQQIKDRLFLAIVHACINP